MTSLLTHIAAHSKIESQLELNTSAKQPVFLWVWAFNAQSGSE